MTHSIPALVEILRRAAAELPEGDPERLAAWENAMPAQRPCPDCGYCTGHDIECLSRA
jgi:hypothetical protein